MSKLESGYNGCCFSYRLLTTVSVPLCRRSYVLKIIVTHFTTAIFKNSKVVHALMHQIIGPAYFHLGFVTLSCTVDLWSTEMAYLNFCDEYICRYFTDAAKREQCELQKKRVRAHSPAVSLPESTPTGELSCLCVVTI